MAKSTTRYIRLPEDWLQRRSVLRAGLEGRALYLAGQFHSAEHLTDGQIDRELIHQLAAAAGVGDGASAAAALERCGLWAATEDGWQDTEYLLQNWSREQYEGYVNQRRASGKLGGRPRKDAPADNHDGYPENHDGKHDGLPGNHDGYRENHDANHDGKHDGYSGGEITIPKPSPNHPGNHPETIPKPRLSSSSSLSAVNGQEVGGEARASDRAPSQPRGRAREGASAGADDQPPNVVALRPDAPPDAAFLKRTYRAFVASYGKSVTAACQDIWPKHATSAEAVDRIMEGLLAWRQSRQWMKDGEDWVTNPITFLEERHYETPPLPWKAGDAPPPIAEETDAQHQGRARGTGKTPPAHGAGDVNDPFWRDNAGIVTDSTRRHRAPRRAAT